jgi:hypothetical protein
MEIKKVRSAGDPDVVRVNRSKPDPAIFCLFAIITQLLATIYIWSSDLPVSAGVTSIVLTIVYILVSYELNKPWSA